MRTAVETATEIRPFRIETPQDELDDLRRRVMTTHWPNKELVSDRSQGVQLRDAQGARALLGYGVRLAQGRGETEQPPPVHDGDRRTPDPLHSRQVAARGRIAPDHDARLARLDRRVARRPSGRSPDPTAHGGRAEDAFDVVLPSIPGYGFSAEPTEVGWNSGRVAEAWAELMHRLEYTGYVAQGGDQGASVTDAMARQAAKGLIGIHLNLLVSALGTSPPAETDEERAATEALATFRTTGYGYFLEQATRPQTIGYALLDSPLALAAWILDHDTDSYYKISRAFVDGRPSGNLTCDHILDNVTLYWLTGTGASAARSYWESRQAGVHGAGKAPKPVQVPVGYTTFPGEIFRASRRWVEGTYPSLTYFNEVDKGGHFAAWEEPELFTAELRAASVPPMRARAHARARPASIVASRSKRESGADAARARAEAVAVVISDEGGFPG